MRISPFHAYRTARSLSRISYGSERLLAAYASSTIEIYPHQMAAALFALRSSYQKGVILCDEGSLGKTYEALLVVSQRWCEGLERILVAVPTPLLHQWQQVFTDSFSIPYFSIADSAAWEERRKNQENPFLQDGVILTTYDFAAEKAEWLTQIPWQLAVFEEAHHLRGLYKETGERARALREATAGAFKLLLTATPMINSLMDLYGLIAFIDDTALPDEETFYKRYFRKPEYYPELAERVSPFCFRTTRAQAAATVKIPERIPVTVEYTLTEPEQRLYQGLEVYLQKPRKLAYPDMDPYDLTLLFTRTFFSSTFAVAKPLRGACQRLEERRASEPDNAQLLEEIEELRALWMQADAISENAKGAALLTALKTGFARLKTLGAKRKALIFTENRTTQRYLVALLRENGYRDQVLSYSGDKSRDTTVMERFRDEAAILVATDVAAEGFNLEFCSFVVNYDLPYRILTIEQRINRCHRQGQACDVLVVNFLNRHNFADVRMLELINKRIRQFDGVFGLTDAVIGGFGLSVEEALRAARPRKEIDREWGETLQAHEEENTEQVRQAEESLFTTFSRDVAQHVTISPQYVREKAREWNDALWEVTRAFFADKPAFTLDETTRTVSCVGTPPRVFTGARMGRNEYSMAPDYQPRSGRHTLTGPLARNILKEIFWKGVPEKGTVTVEGAAEPAQIAFYEVRVGRKGDYTGGVRYDVLAGRTAGGRVLTDEECRRYMDLPVLRYTVDGEPHGGRDASYTPAPHELDALLHPADFIRRAMEEEQSADQEEISRLRRRETDQKRALDRRLDSLRVRLKAARQAEEKAETRLAKIQAQKTAAALTRELKQGEQNLFLEKLKIEQETEQTIAALTDASGWTAEVKRVFVIQIVGGALC